DLQTTGTCFRPFFGGASLSISGIAVGLASAQSQCTDCVRLECRLLTFVGYTRRGAARAVIYAPGRSGWKTSGPVETCTSQSLPGTCASKGFAGNRYRTAGA